MAKKQFIVNADIDEIRKIYENYGITVAEAMLDKICHDLKNKIKKEVDFSQCHTGAKVLVEG